MTALIGTPLAYVKTSNKHSVTLVLYSYAQLMGMILCQSMVYIYLNC